MALSIVSSRKQTGEASVISFLLALSVFFLAGKKNGLANTALD